MRGALGVLLLTVSAASGGAAAVASFLVLVRVSADVVALEGVAVLVFLAVTWGLAWAVSSRLWRARRLPASAATAVLGLVVLGLVARSTVLRPMDFPYTPAREPAGVAYWELATGSRLAYLRTPAAGDARPFPVVFLHGGPGQAVLMDEEVRRPLAEAGFEVYTYHQHGAGLSSRATSSRAEEYTVARHVADLEAIRQAVAAERLILVGHSWGATLAASYAAAHPRRIEKLVLTSPGPSWLPAFGIEKIRALERLSAEDRAELAGLIRPLVPRLAFHRYLLAIHPEAAGRFLSERRLDGFVEAQVEILKRAYVCDPAAVGGVSYPGQGYWVNRHVFADLARVSDPRPRFREVDAPVLIVRPECDFVDLEVAVDFRDRFPRATLVTIPGAGHEIRLERPDLYLDVLLAFMLDERARD